MLSIRASALSSALFVCASLTAVADEEPSSARWWARPAAAAAEPASPTDGRDVDSTPAHPGLLRDVGAYLTAPIRWDLRDWGYFAGSLALTGAAHHYDSQVRTHFTRSMTPAQAFDTKNSKDLQDAAPAAAAFAVTWLYASLTDDSYGRSEAWCMLEAGGLSSVTALVLKYPAGRKRPNETTDPNRWRAGGSSFPSLHAAAAFAVGTVLAESGNDEYRWLRRTLGYGIAGFTAYERLKHNDHWLSDDVAGAALGAATAAFVMKRQYRQVESAASGLMVVPVAGGAMLAYSRELPN